MFDIFGKKKKKHFTRCVYCMLSTPVFQVKYCTPDHSQKTGRRPAYVDPAECVDSVREKRKVRQSSWYQYRFCGELVSPYTILMGWE